MRGLNFGPLWQRAHLPNWEVRSAADTALFVAIWHQKHIRVKLNNGLLTNEIEETDILKGGGSRFRDLAHVPDRSARVPSSTRVPGVARPWLSTTVSLLFYLTLNIRHNKLPHNAHIHNLRENRNAWLPASDNLRGLG